MSESEKEKKNKFGPFGEFLLNTSTALWEGLLNEPDKSTLQTQALEDMKAELQKAALEKSIVVLLVEKQYNHNYYETITGWIAAKEFGPVIPVKLPNDLLPIQMVPLERVKKISVLAKDGTKKSITRP